MLDCSTFLEMGPHSLSNILLYFTETNTVVFANQCNMQCLYQRLILLFLLISVICNVYINVYLKSLLLIRSKKVGKFFISVTSGNSTSTIAAHPHGLTSHSCVQNYIAEYMVQTDS